MFFHGTRLVIWGICHKLMHVYLMMYNSRVWVCVACVNWSLKHDLRHAYNPITDIALAHQIGALYDAARPRKNKQEQTSFDTLQPKFCVFPCTTNRLTSGPTDTCLEGPDSNECSQLLCPPCTFVQASLDFVHRWLSGVYVLAKGGIAQVSIYLSHMILAQARSDLRASAW